jgi:hypothetical protein
MQTNNDEFNKAEFNRAKKIVNEYKTKRKEALIFFSQYKKNLKKEMLDERKFLKKKFQNNSGIDFNIRIRLQFLYEKKRKEALNIFSQYKKNLKTERLDAIKFLKTVPNNIKFQNINKEMRIWECQLSARLFRFFCIWGFDEKSKISDLSNISVNEFHKIYRGGKVTLQELKDLCFHAGISIQDNT